MKYVYIHDLQKKKKFIKLPVSEEGVVHDTAGLGSPCLNLIIYHWPTRGMKRYIFVERVQSLNNASTRARDKI